MPKDDSSKSQYSAFFLDCSKATWAAKKLFACKIIFFLGSVNLNAISKASVPEPTKN